MSSATPPPRPPGPPDGSGFRVDATLAYLRKLRRVRDGRVLGGVCAGIGRGLGVDPVVIRVALAVLTFFGGVSALLYGAAWLLIPEEGKDRSVLEHHLGRRQNGSPDNAVVIGGVVLVAIVLLSTPWWGLPWQAPVLLLLAIVGLIVLARRNVVAGGTDPGAPGVPASPGDPNAPTQPLAGWPAAPTTTVDEVTGVVAGTGSWRDAVPAPASFWNHPDPLGLADPDPDPTQALVEAPPPPPLPVKRRSAVFPVTIASTLIAMGGLAAVAEANGWSLEPGAFIATALAVVGGGLLVGTWYGRARGLIAIGVLLTIALIPATVAERVDTGDFATQATGHSPTTAEDVMSRYDIEAGDFTLDLSGVTFDDRTNLTTKLDVGAGHAIVIVPDDVDVQLRGDVGLGSLEFFGVEEGGVDLRRSHQNLGADGAGGGTLVLQLDLGLGAAELYRTSMAPPEAFRIEPPEAPVPPEPPQPADKPTPKGFR
ncbi:PspC domain-containing protein [Tenggerimyces flavus]|uniref:PspC domain-containing protein n=1 Tax=Tenggerimyces flavus TaxID=1708749 RepID=A0ABV7Y500_9ACTN|nr:PspC domain-containing protein [Tenggerimyces flavus]MBM7790927.1 phage shock protein PspC (stress-responsive transcriptional regulator) [Tenggerimyces flavus]